jgi:hypothetical protein
MAAQPDGRTSYRQLELRKRPHRVKSQAELGGESLFLQLDADIVAATLMNMTLHRALISIQRR